MVRSVLIDRQTNLVTPARSKKVAARSGGNSACRDFQITQFPNYKIKNFFRLVLPYCEIDPPVDNPRYLP
jgi:hypothetical protein